MDKVVHAAFQDGAVGVLREVEAIVRKFEPAFRRAGLDEAGHHLEQVKQVAAILGIVDGVRFRKSVPAGTEDSRLIDIAIIREEQATVSEGAIFHDKAPGLWVLIVPLKAGSLVVFVRKHLEAVLRELLLGRKSVPAAVCSFQHQV